MRQPDAPAVPERGAEPSVRRAREGDVEAFEQLYRRYVHRVYALCLRMCGDPDLAERLTQDAFVAAWRSLESFRGESAFSTWLHRVAVNVVLQDRRARSRERERNLLRGQDPEATASPPAPTELKIDLERAIAALPPGARTVFVLHDVEGYTHRDIADMTGIAEGTSKAQLHRARKLLKGVLRDGS